MGVEYDLRDYIRQMRAFELERLYSLGSPGIVGSSTAVPTEPPCGTTTFVAAGTNIDNAEKLLLQRLRRKFIPDSMFQHMHIAVLPEKTFVTLYKGNEMTTLEDNTAMFPSDNLVNAMRLLLG